MSQGVIFMFSQRPFVMVYSSGVLKACPSKVGLW